MTNHDFSHCSGHDLMGTTQAPIVCSIRNQCHRYKMWKELQRQQNNYQVSMIMPSECMNNDHNLFLEKQIKQKGVEK